MKVIRIENERGHIAMFPYDGRKSVHKTMEVETAVRDFIREQNEKQPGQYPLDGWKVEVYADLGANHLSCVRSFKTGFRMI
ncbi:hypothetical protein V9W64_10645 [Neisseria leonii]|uniref:Uncharacterized protein n=1 Tax=Neisseria leonii TaxID=2995413 RepID=A0A9X4E379_9NEIS|nr:hypothetical protein [Neisseria sp. 51.81]MDD9328790.1 hypothetical protein [Neisseria sp. 51.81]